MMEITHKIKEKSETVKAKIKKMKYKTGTNRQTNLNSQQQP